MDPFPILMTGGALVGLILVVFGAFLLVKKFQGDIEIALKIGSLKTGSAGLAVIALGLLFFLSCSLSLKTAVDNSQALSQKDGEIAQHETAASTLIDQLAGALSGQSDEAKNAILTILLKSEDQASSAPAASPPAVGATTQPPASHPAAAPPVAKPAPAMLTPSYHTLSANFVAALLHTVNPEALEKMKEANPRLQQHLAASPPGDWDQHRAPAAALAGTRLPVAGT